MHHKDADIQWFVITDPADIAQDLDRAETAMEKLNALPNGLGSMPYKIQGFKQAARLVQYLRIANDIA